MFSLEAWEKGWAAMCPHKNTSGFQHTDIPWSVWMDGDLAFIDRMNPEKGDALFMMPGWETSTGATIERDHAVDMGLLIYYPENGIPNLVDGGN